MTQANLQVKVNFEPHQHDQMVHAHEHIHITHHVQGGDIGQVEHLTSMHTHQHNHAPLDHAHTPHEDFDREHGHEAHIHDHEHPADS